MAEAKPTSSPPPADTAAFEAAVEAGKTSLDAGRSVPYEKVRRWLLSWGSEGNAASEMRVVFSSEAVEDLASIRILLASTRLTPRRA
ncbi:MAG TPA: hypothetical protein VGL66_00690 [Caulobacteraceae bacterium]|jgi:hypothetical protein